MRTILLCLLMITYGKTVGHAVVTAKPEAPNDNNVFIITVDGLRWQELFSGADVSLLNDIETSAQEKLKTFFWAKDEKQRRKKLMPFT